MNQTPKKQQSQKVPLKQASQPKNQPKKQSNNDWVGIIIIILLGIIIYSNSFNCSFHFDDLTRIVNNPGIRNLSDVKAWSAIYPSRPVGMFTFALNYHVSQLNVQSYHAINLLIHLINALLVGWLTLLIFSSPVLIEQPVSKNKKWIAFFAALLFVSHPLATQSVTYIIQRLNALAVLFYLLSLVLYLKARLSKSFDSHAFFLYGGSFVSALLAIFTKENAITLPIIIILAEFSLLRTNKIRINFKDYRVFLIIFAVLILIFLFLVNFSSDIFKTIPASQYNPTPINPFNYLLTQFSVILKYIQLLILPVSQNLDYDFSISNSFFDLRTILSFLVLSSLLFIAVYFFKKIRILSFCILWFFITISIESGIIPINDVIFEHRTYLPSVGFFILLSWAVFYFLWNKYKGLSIIIFLLIIGSNSILAFDRNKVWQDDLSLWGDAALKSPGKARPFINLGFAHTNSGQIDLALEDYTKAIENNPEFTDSYYNRGLIYINTGRFESAIADLSKAVEIDPKYAKGYADRGVAYYSLKQWDKSLADYSKAIELKPDFADALFNRGLLYGSQGQPDKAITDFSKVISIDPRNIRALSMRANVYANLRQMDKAIADYSKVVFLDPGSRDSYYGRGIGYMNLGKADKAINDFTKALEIGPNFYQAYSNRGLAQASLEHNIEAIDDYSKAIMINPGFADAYVNRATAYYNTGKRDEALADFARALEIDPNNTTAKAARDMIIRNVAPKKLLYLGL
jgi:protein O-mannosyl-transferase